jgi:hypothetical protein
LDPEYGTFFGHLSGAWYFEAVCRFLADLPNTVSVCSNHTNFILEIVCTMCKTGGGGGRVQEYKYLQTIKNFLFIVCKYLLDWSHLE